MLRKHAERHKSQKKLVENSSTNKEVQLEREKKRNNPLFQTIKSSVYRWVTRFSQVSQW